ncbi:hypothetical protein P8452_48502 [Trifolium repens]|nr:hypothetical protein P8452_48502 [Trifolium repens]
MIAGHIYNLPTVCETDADCPTSEDLYFDIKCIDHMCFTIVDDHEQPSTMRCDPYLRWGVLARNSLNNTTKSTLVF